MGRLASFVLPLTFFACISPAARAIIIDDFSAGPFALEAVRFQPQSTNAIALPTAQTIGGERFVTFGANGPSADSKVRLAVYAAHPGLQYDADPGATAINLSVRYGNQTPLNANLSADGANALVFDFASVDFESGIGYFDMTFSTQSISNYLYVPIQDSAAPVSLVVPYRAFQRNATNVNFANITRFQFGTGNGNLRGDFTLNQIRTAYFPEGDYNFDGAVDGTDLAVWRTNFANEGLYGGSYPVNAADGNRDGFVNAADYILWRNNRSTGSSPALAAPIPEPQAILLIFSACLSAAARRQTRS